MRCADADATRLRRFRSICRGEQLQSRIASDRGLLPDIVEVDTQHLLGHAFSVRMDQQIGVKLDDLGSGTSISSFRCVKHTAAGFSQHSGSDSWRVRSGPAPVRYVPRQRVGFCAGHRLAQQVDCVKRVFRRATAWRTAGRHR